MQLSNEAVLAVISLVGTIVISTYKFIIKLDQHKKELTAEKIKIALSLPEKDRADYLLSMDEKIRLDINKISKKVYDEIVKEIYSAKRLQKKLNFTLILFVLILIGSVSHSCSKGTNIFANGDVTIDNSTTINSK